MVIEYDTVQGVAEYENIFQLVVREWERQCSRSSSSINTKRY